MTEPVVTSENLSALRRETEYAYSLAECRQALESTGGDVEGAVAILERQGHERTDSRHHEPVRLGDEEPNDDVRWRYELIVQRQRSTRSDPVEHYLAFDFRQKIMALTRDRVLIIPNSGVETSLAFDGLSGVSDTGHDREIALVDHTGHQHTFRVGDPNVASLVRGMIRSRIGAGSLPEAAAGNGPGSTSEASDRDENGFDDDSAPGIADRVRFWEEQDRINRELIPRVIRQHELLTGHIAEHDSLPEVAARAISEALATARQEQQRQFAEALGEARAELAQQFDARLQQALEQLDSALNTARAELSNEAAADLARALAELQSALTDHQTRLDDQHQSNLQQALTAIQTEARKSRNLLIGIAAGSGAISIALIVVNLLTG